MPPAPDTAIAIRGLTKSFQRAGGVSVRAVDGVNLDVMTGELLVLLGPSGCGKTTLLRVLAGLESADTGRVEIDGRAVLDHGQGLNVPTHRRPLNMVFQSYALWPHMTAIENVEYPLQNKRPRPRDIRARAVEALEMVDVRDVAHQYPGQMSGGQQQRVALARAVVGGDAVILFDEPLSNVDAKVRARLRHEIIRMQSELGFTGVYVTHDQEEALTLGNRIAVLREGRIQQLGAPSEIYDNPRSRYVASFVGSINELVGTAATVRDAYAHVTTGIGTMVSARTDAVDGHSDVVVMIRPEAFTVTDDIHVDRSPNSFLGTVEKVLYLGGARNEYIVRVSDVRLTVWAHGGAALPSDTDVLLDVTSRDVHVFPRVGP